MKPPVSPANLLYCSEQTVEVEQEAPSGGRRITGRIVVWDQVGNTSAGPTRFVPGSIVIPDDPSRVKLLIDHNMSDAVGYMEHAEEDETGILATFVVPEDIAGRGDQALEWAATRIRDGFSVGVGIDDYEFDGDVLVIRSSRLNETSLIPIPAFRDALVTEVTAQRKDQFVSRAILALAASDGAPQPAGTVAPTPQTASDGALTAAEAASTAPAPSGSTRVEATAVPPAAGAPAPGGTVTAAEAPVPAPAPAPAASPAVVVEHGSGARRLAELTAQHFRNGGSPDELPRFLTAALNDVTPANITPTGVANDYGPRRTELVRDLWQSAEVVRPMIDAFGVDGAPQSLKFGGFVWDVRPEVAAYSGNKAAVPSNQPKRKWIETSVQRFAGGWDVDRVFVDLPGGTDEIADIFTEATRDYAAKSEAYVSTTVLAGATELDPSATVIDALTLIGQHFASPASGRGARITTVQLGADAWSELLSMTADQAPWWMQRLGQINLGTSEGEAGGIRFALNYDLDGGVVLAGDRRAVKIKETTPPVRVRAENIPNGGVDIGVFGYVGALVLDPRAIVTTTVGGTAG